MIIKCKMCGGDIQFTPGATYGTCEYCGSTSTIPRADDEGKLNRYNRANHFRRQCEFDKAVAAYEKILEQDDTDAEAHWGAVISRFGIEYVEDPATGKRVPTCHRVQLSSILADEDYKAALQYAPDAESRRLYEEEAARIAEIQKGILAISQNEKPYDVFICYKETDEAGQRTHDSQWAQEVYYGLTEQGYKVFFSRITLEDKLGQEYEPYIFAALQSAKVMVVIGSKPEYFNAVWVKNEWSRYLALMAKDRKRLLIPCYRGMDPYDLPDELSSLQSQDMSKIGFMQDLLRGIRKVLEAEKKPEQPQGVQQVVPAASPDAAAPGIASLMKRIQLFLEDGDFKQASDYIDRVLDIDPEYAPAYAAKVCVAFGLRKESALADATFLYEDNPDWQKALRFADPQQKAAYEGYYAKVDERVAQQMLDYTYDCAMAVAVQPGLDWKKLNQELDAYKLSCTRSSGERANGARRRNSRENEADFQEMLSRNDTGDMSEAALKVAADMFAAIGDERGKERAAQCRQLAEQARQKVIYTQAVEAQRKAGAGDAPTMDRVAAEFETILAYKDAKEQAKKCRDAAENARQRLYETAQKAISSAGTSSVNWRDALTKLKNPAIQGYRDVPELIADAEKRIVQYEREENALATRKAKAEKEKKKRITVIATAAVVLIVAAVILVTQVIIPNGKYNNAMALQQAEKYEEAITAFEALNGYGDSATQITETKYLKAKYLTTKGDYAGAAAIFIGIKGYKDVDGLLKNDDNLSAAVAAAFKTPGSYVVFGTYPQTETGNDSTPIEWVVLDYDAKNNSALLLSRYGLDAKPYNTEYYTSITWEECTLRTWLNGTFMNKAFTAQEQGGILQTNVDNSKSQCYSEWSSSGGNNTQDRIFLLSYAEANKYLSVEYWQVTGAENNTKSRVAPTAYAVKQGALTSSDYKTTDGTAAGSWWLRSPGFDQKNAAHVYTDGSLSNDGVSAAYVVVRPALWINLESDIF